MAKKEVPIWEKYLLTVEEAAAYFHIGENRLYEFIKNNQHSECLIQVGCKTLIKRVMFEKYLDELSVF